MNCKCGVAAFFYETIKSDKIKYSVYKCGILHSESKRGKCDFILETELNKIKLPSYEIKPPETSIELIKNNKNDFYKNLENYIYLLEISKNNYGMSKFNYISNINFILKKPPPPELTLVITIPFSLILTSSTDTIIFLKFSSIDSVSLERL